MLYKTNVKFVLSLNNAIFGYTKLYNMISTKTERSIFENTFENTSVAKLIVDMNGNIIKGNKAICNLLEYPEDELLKLTSKDITPSGYCGKDRDSLSQLGTNDIEAVRYETQCVTKYNKVVNLSANAILIGDKSNKNTPAYILKEIVKISSDEELKQEIKEKDFFFEKIMSEMPASIYFKDTENRYILINNAVAKNFGTTRDKVLGKTNFDFFANDFAKKTFEEDIEVMRTGKVIKKLEKAYWPDGSYSWVSYVKKRLLDIDGSLIGTFGISKDITETINTENELNETHKELTIRNKELKITLDNLREAQTQLVSSAKLADLGQLIAGIAHEINTPLGAISASSSNINYSFENLIDSIDFVITTLKKQEVPILQKIIELYKTRSEPNLSSRDKRKIKNNINKKLELLKLENSSKISDMLVYMGLQEYADIIIEDTKNSDLYAILSFLKNLVSINKNSDNISIATEKASNIVLALKKYLHNSQEDNYTKTDIIDNLETVLVLNQNSIKQGIDIVKDYDEIPLINAYPDEISKVWNNILTNAFHAMDNNGKMIIKVKNEKENIVLTFSDTGCGIPEDKRDKIFTPFFTTKISGEGTGLGLDITKRVIEKHNGTIDFESEVGKGTTFIIKLPKM